MDLIIKYIVEGKYNDFINIIATTCFDIIEIENLTHLFMYMFLNDKIDNHRLFVFIYYATDKFDICTLLQKKCSDIKEFYDPKNQFILLFLSLKNNIKVNKEGINNIVKIITESRINNKIYDLTYCTFPKFVNGNFSILLTSYSNSRMTDISNSEQFKLIQEEEMLNRLTTLTKLVGLKLLKFMSVPIMTYGDFVNMKYDEKRKYFDTCMDKIGVANSTLKEMANKKSRLSMEKIQYDTFYDKIIKNKLDDLDELTLSSSNDSDDIQEKYINIESMLNDLVSTYFN
jgi:hypothetical protein